MTTINVTTPALDKLSEDCAKSGGSFYRALSKAIQRGDMEAIVKDMAVIAKAVEKAGYVSPEKREQYDYHDRLAKSVSDREVAAYHRERANQIAKQIGEDVEV
jgi:hypothetical protein